MEETEATGNDNTARKEQVEKNILPSMIARAIREKMTKWQSEMRRDSVVEKKWKLMGRSQDEMVCRDGWGLTRQEKRRSKRDRCRNGGKKSENGR